MTARTVAHDWSKPSTQETPMPDTELNQALATTDPKTNGGVARNNPKALIKAEVERYKTAVSKSLPQSYEGGADRFVRSVLNAVMADKKGDLIKCAPISIVGAALHAAQLGLEIGPLQEAYLVPRGGDCTFMAGYKGLIKLAYLGGWDTEAEVVREGDEFSYQYGTNPHLVHVPARAGERGKPTEWWAMATRMDGRRSKFRVIDQAHVDKRAKVGGPVWRQWPEEMALKTAVRALMVTVPLSAKAESMVLAMNSEGIVRKELEPSVSPADYADAAALDEDVVDGEIVE